VFERVEQLEELVTDPLAVAAAPNPRGRSTPVSWRRFNAARAAVGVTP